MKNTYKVLIVLLLFVIVGVAFYWYEYRPSKIRKDCTEKVKNSEKFKGADVVVDLQLNEIERCFHEKGI